MKNLYNTVGDLLRDHNKAGEVTIKFNDKCLHSTMIENGFTPIGLYPFYNETGYERDLRDKDFYRYELYLRNGFAYATSQNRFRNNVRNMKMRPLCLPTDIVLYRELFTDLIAANPEAQQLLIDYAGTRTYAEKNHNMLWLEKWSAMNPEKEEREVVGTDASITIPIKDWSNPRPDIARAGIDSFLYFTGLPQVGKATVTLFKVEDQYLYYIASKPKKGKLTVRLEPLTIADVERLDRKFHQDGRFIRQMRQAFMKPKEISQLDISNLTEVPCLIRTGGFMEMNINVAEHFNVFKIRFCNAANGLTNGNYHIELIAKDSTSPMGHLQIETDIELNILNDRTWLDPKGWPTHDEFKAYLTNYKRKRIAEYHNS